MYYLWNRFLLYQRPVFDDHTEIIVCDCLQLQKTHRESYLLPVRITEQALRRLLLS